MSCAQMKSPRVFSGSLGTGLRGCGEGFLGTKGEEECHDQILPVLSEVSVDLFRLLHALIRFLLQKILCFEKAMDDVEQGSALSYIADACDLGAFDEEGAAVRCDELLRPSPSSEMMNHVECDLSQPPWITAAILAARRGCEEAVETLLCSLDREVDVIRLV